MLFIACQHRLTRPDFLQVFRSHGCRKQRGIPTLVRSGLVVLLALDLARVRRQNSQRIRLVQPVAHTRCDVFRLRKRASPLLFP